MRCDLSEVEALHDALDGVSPGRRLELLTKHTEEMCGDALSLELGTLLWNLRHPSQSSMTTEHIDALGALWDEVCPGGTAALERAQALDAPAGVDALREACALEEGAPFELASLERAAGPAQLAVGLLLWHVVRGESQDEVAARRTLAQLYAGIDSAATHRLFFAGRGWKMVFADLSRAPLTISPRPARAPGMVLVGHEYGIDIQGASVASIGEDGLIAPERKEGGVVMMLREELVERGVGEQVALVFYQDVRFGVLIDALETLEHVVPNASVELIGHTPDTRNDELLRASATPLARGRHPVRLHLTADDGFVLVVDDERVPPIERCHDDGSGATVCPRADDAPYYARRDWQSVSQILTQLADAHDAVTVSAEPQVQMYDVQLALDLARWRVEVEQPATRASEVRLASGESGEPVRLFGTVSVEAEP